MRKFLLPLIVMIAPAWSVHSLVTVKAAHHWNFDKPFEIGRWEAFALVHLVICLLSLWIGIELIFEWIHQKQDGEFVVAIGIRKYRALLLGSLALAAHQPALSQQTHKAPEENAVPVGLLLTPAMATLLINDLLRRRREQIRRQFFPDVLSDIEQVLLSDVRELATKDVGQSAITELDISVPIVQTLTSAVERSHIDQSETLKTPQLIVRLYGYPEVRGVDGQSATFRKKRALELVVWLSLNRDRARRSAARIALWQVDVSDSTFSTIVSDMRRGIADVAVGLGRSEIVPTTYSDEITLSNRVTTDYELLRGALQKFRDNPMNYRKLVGELQEIRDAPFSGTAYEWADLDGTTTRLIITAMQAAHELARYAQSIGDVESMQIAVVAGLRVMPGDEELLQIQQSFIPVVSMSHSVKNR